MSMSSTQARHTAGRPYACNCGHCQCKVQVSSSIKICRACRNGAHDLRSFRRLRAAASISANQAPGNSPHAPHAA
jgi:hypothetical protein